MENNLVLNVTYENKGGGNVKVEWRNNKGLIIERSRNGVIYCRDKRADIEMGSNLILRNTSLYDNGLYKFTEENENGSPPLLTFAIIIQGRRVYSEYFWNRCIGARGEGAGRLHPPLL